MLLLYLDPRVPKSLRDLNLHSTMLLLYRRTAENLSGDIAIYIPLCFYFIRPGIHWRRKKITFTFHYASTLSSPCRPRWTLLIIFTFHYASTLSRSCLLKQTITIYLHSTMLLLYRQHWAGSPKWYISFTFHYASTLSSPRSWAIRLMLNLHSTMLLLYRK